MRRWLVAMNAQAGSRAVAPTKVRSALDSAGIEYSLEAPATPEEMRAVISSHLDAGGTHLAVVGGDGTANLAVNALLQRDIGERPVLGILPAGTGCDLLRTFGLPQDLHSAATHLAGDNVYAIDVAYLDGGWGRHHFVNVAQAGVGAAAAESATKFSRRMGAGRYPLAFLQRLPRFPRAEIKLTTERRTIESEALAVIFANAQFFAGGWNVAPRATLIDGLLDIQVINTAKTRAPALVPKIVRGTHLTDRAVRRISAAEFDLTTSASWPVEADGDLLGNTSVAGRVIPAAINLKI
ncbi:MAG: YegS/Rv2252/BmrU family lipid kinase [Acidimicrobiia bacterium]|nr:YegS/Rv2252/BmrU family lipid kinase [Acidimicrobiia bacterium]